MKNILSLLAILIMLVSSCTKKEIAERNGFTYNDKFYATESFGLNYRGANHFDLYLTTGNFDAGCDCLVGNNELLIDIEIFSYENGDLAIGYYNSSNSQHTGTYEGGNTSFKDGISFTGNYHMGAVTGNAWNILGGKVEVERSNSDYILDYYFALSNGETISGKYKGSKDFVWMN